MRFFNIITLASFAFATPLVVERQQQTVTGTILNSVNTLDNAVRANIEAINGAIATARDNVEADVIVEVQTILRANFQAIAEAFRIATEAIVAVTTGAAGGVAGQARGLTRAQVEQLVEAIRAAARIVNGLGITLTAYVTDLTPDVRDALDAEFQAVRNAIAPFVQPLLAFGAAVRRAQAGVGVVVTGLENALTEFGGIISRLITSIGLPGLDLSTLNGLLSGLGLGLRP